jgi:tetratricopeptide (TPR) repeat protein
VGHFDNRVLRMSDPVIKGAKRPASRPATRGASPASSAKNRKLSAKSARPKPLAKRSPAGKAPVRKAAKAKTGPAGPAKGSRAVAAKPKTSPAKSAKPAAKKSVKSARPAAKTSSKGRTSTRPAAKQPQRKPAPAPAKSAAKLRPGKPAAHTAARPAARPAPPPPRQPTQDEAAALKAFERAHKEFVRGRFAEARMLFRQLIDQHAGVAEVTARSRTYLAIAEARLRSESALPRNAEELYDRGVIELNRGEYVAAQELFERASKRDPEAAHIHYGLAATRARLGSIDLALQSLERAVNLQPTLRGRAQHDHDLAVLRNDPEYERIIFAQRA